MIENSILNETIIKKLVWDNYKIVVDEVVKLNRGSANIYVLNNKSLILKEFQTSCNKEDLIKEIEVINHLKKKGIPVPEYKKTINNQFYFIYENRLIIIQNFISGYTKELNTGDEENVMESAVILGRITESLQSLDYNLPVQNYKKWVSVESLDNSIISMQKFIEGLGDDFQDIKQDLEDKIHIINSIKHKVESTNCDNLTILNTHGDYNVLQCIYNDNRISAVIDFISACRMPIIWEIIRSYSYIDKDVVNGEFNLSRFIDYVNECRKRINLNDDDLKLMPLLYLCQLLTSNFGYKQYVLDTNKVDLLKFGKFRTKLCRYLFNHLDELEYELKTKVH